MTIEIEKELKEIIQIPTILLDKDGVPIEYKSSQKKRKIKVRNLEKISVHLMMLIIKNNGDAESIERFSSGNFIGFLNRNRAYTSL